MSAAATASAATPTPSAAATTPVSLPSPSIQLARSLGTVNIEEINSMSPFELFKSQLESPSTEGNVDAMKRLGVVALAMGSEDAASTLLPYITQIALKQPQYPDELLLLLGQQLITVVDLLGKPFITEFLPILERLATIEETVVRDQAVTVICYLCEKASGSDASPWMALVKRLASADWFTAKVSVCGMIAPIMAASMSNVGTIELLSLYKDLCSDETPMVRRSAAKHLGHVLYHAGYGHKEFCLATLIPLCHDEQDSVRLLAVASLANVGGMKDGKDNAYNKEKNHLFGSHPDWTCQHWLPIVKDGSTDMSWRVRHNLAKNFSDVAVNLGIQHDRKYGNEQSLVMACFVSLLTDNEAEVRAAAVGHLAQMISWGGAATSGSAEAASSAGGGGHNHFASHIQPLLPALADDVVMEVRSKCALSLMDAAHSGSLEDSIILQNFGPLLESFLQDEFHEVQLQVLSNLHKIAHLLPGLSGVVTTLLQMSKATNWRVREAVAKLLPHLAEARGLDFFVSVLMEPSWLTLLLDPVATVRMAIVNGMSLLVSVSGEDWMVQALLPQHVRIYNQNSNNYLIRMTLLRAHIETAVAPACTPGNTLWNDLILQILRGLNDKVANVRTLCSRGMLRIVTDVNNRTGGNIGEGVGGTSGASGSASMDAASVAAIIQSQFRPALDKRVAEEDDEDCKMICQMALDQIH